MAPARRWGVDRQPLTPPAARRVALITVVTLLVLIGGLATWWVVTRPSDDVCDGERGPAALVAVDATTGERLWTRLVGNASWPSMSLHDENIHLSTQGHDLAVAIDSGDLVRCVDVGTRIVDVRATTRPRLHENLPAAEPDVQPAIGPGASGQLEVVPEDGATRQERRVTVREESGAQRWARTIPGFEVHLIGGMVVSIDQTGGTGQLDPFGPDTRITAYAWADGVELWQVPLPGTPYEAISAGNLIVVPGETLLFGIDADSGDIRWQVDHGSPGQNRKYSYAGGYRRLLASADEQIVVGIIQASAPYRD